MEHLLFAAYLVFFAWLVTKVPFFTHSGLTKTQLVILFLLKVMAGIFYGWIGIYYGEMAQMMDTWAYHVESIQEYALLKTHPQEFFTSLFHNSYVDGYTHFLTTENSWWNDVKANFLIKLLAIFNLFSYGHYYTNVIFYCFVAMFGPIAFFRVMQDVFPTRRTAVLLATFLLPSFLYWTSGIHKEGLLFAGLALITYHVYFGLSDKRLKWYRIPVIVISFLMVLILRNFIVLGLIPAVFAWMLAYKSGKRPIIMFSVVAVAFVLIFFTARFISPALDFPGATVNRQNEFMHLGGASAVQVNKLEPNFKSFVRNTPQALTLTLVRPYPSDVRHLLSLAASVEINLLLLLFVVFLIWRKNGSTRSDFLLFCLFFSFCILLVIGYSVNIIGAIVRYRSILFPFLLVPMIAKIDWNKIFVMASDLWKPKPIS